MNTSELLSKPTPVTVMTVAPSLKMGFGDTPVTVGTGVGVNVGVGSCACTGAGITTSIKASRSNKDIDRRNPGFIVLPVLFQ
jgi:hypothetical protein